MKKISIPCRFGDKIVLVDFLVGMPAAGVHPLEQQALWLLHQRGGTVPAHTMDVISELLESSREQGGNFEELAAQHFTRPEKGNKDPNEADRKSGFRFDSAGRLIPMTEAELLAADESGSSVIVLDRGTNIDGRPYWAYIAVKSSKYGEFMKGHQRIKLEDYGTILRYGYDKEVPWHVREEMAKEHDFSDDFMEQVARDIETSRIAFLAQQAAPRISAALTAIHHEGKQENGPRKVTIACELNDFDVLVDVVAGTPAEAAHPVRQQADWLMREHGFAISAGTMGLFQELLRIAKETDVSFPELAARVMSH